MKNLDEAKWAVLFISKKRTDILGYELILERMLEKVQKIPGFMHLQTFVNEQNKSITISYWKDRASINKWAGDKEHIEAQKRGIVDWYSEYQVFVCKIEDYYNFKAQ